MATTSWIFLLHRTCWVFSTATTTSISTNKSAAAITAACTTTAAATTGIVYMHEYKFLFLCGFLHTCTWFYCPSLRTHMHAGWDFIHSHFSSQISHYFNIILLARTVKWIFMFHLRPHLINRKKILFFFIKNSSLFIRTTPS